MADKTEYEFEPESRFEIEAFRNESGKLIVEVMPKASYKDFIELQGGLNGN